MRQRGGRRGSGKSARILELIDHYWEAIDRDFAGRGADAYDWVRGLRPWDQFLNWCQEFSDTEGSWLWAKQCEDPRHFAEWQLRYEESLRSSEPYRPPLAGYTGLRSEIRELRNDVRAGRLPPLMGPRTPLDEIKERKKQIIDADLDRSLGYM